MVRSFGMEESMKRYIAVLLIFSMLLIPCAQVRAQAVDNVLIPCEMQLIQQGALVSTTPTKEKKNRQQIRNISEVTPEEDLYQRLYSMETPIDVSEYGLTNTEFVELLQDLINNSPEFFYIGQEISGMTMGGYMVQYSPDYLYSKSQVEDMRTEIDEEVNKILVGVDSAWSEVEKALYVHDYLVANHTYDESLSKFDIYSFLTEKTAVCQGYAMAYIYIMKQLGMSAVAVTSEAMGHMWNAVCVDGEWYHVDLTFDDPLPDIPGSARHQSFLVSDTMLANRPNNEHWDWECEYACTDTTYDNVFWMESSAPFVYGGEMWYYVQNEGDDRGIYQWNPLSGDLDLVVDMSKAKWYTDETQTRYYTKLYTGLIYYDGKIYYNTSDGVNYFVPSEVNVEKPALTQTHEVEIPAFSGSIWGMSVSEDGITCSTGSNYNSAGTPLPAVQFEKPAVTSTPAPATTVSPTETEEPKETELPTGTESPAETEVPAGTPTVPTVTESPTETVPPIETMFPEGTGTPMMPTVTVSPEVTALPEETKLPTGTESPAGTPTVPTVTALPTESMSPEATMCPEETGTLGEKPVVPPASDLGQTGQANTIVQLMEGNNPIQNGTSNGGNINSLGSGESTYKKPVSIRIIAKKGKKKIQIRVPKKQRVIVGLNKKIIKKGKKKVKKLAISKKKNKRGKIKLRLSQKLRKKMVIRVTVYTPQGKVVARKKIK